MSSHAFSAAFSLAAVVTFGTPAPADVLVPDSFRDRVMRLSSVDGAVIDMNFITNASAGGIFQLAIEALQVGNEIWISDQNADSVFRFSLTGAHLGTVVGPAQGLDNIRGIGVIDGILYVTNFGALNGAPGPSIRLFDANNLNPLGSVFPPNVQSPWDVVAFDGWTMVSDGGTITGGGDDTGYVFRLNPNTGQYINTFLFGTRGSNGLSLPKGMCVLSNGNLLIANNSTPQNLYEYNPAGTRVATYPMTGLSCNGVMELDNGEVLVCAQGTGVFGTNGFYALNRGTNALRTILLGSQTADGFIPNFPNRFTPPPPSCPEDVNHDGTINTADLTAVLGLFGQSVPPGTPEDINYDGVVNTADLVALLGVFGTNCPA